MTRQKSGRMDGPWNAPDSEDGYLRYRLGSMEVRTHPDYEPDGELVARHVSAHLERMDSGYWSLILTDADGNDVHVSLYSKRRIRVMWGAEPNR